MHLQSRNETSEFLKLALTAGTQNDSLNRGFQSLQTNDYLIQKHKFRLKQPLIMQNHKNLLK